jgi:membrane protease YdiL (CAAX protease family)
LIQTSRSTSAPAWRANILIATTGYIALLLAFWFIGKHFGVTAKFGRDVPWLFASFALLIGFYWALGLGAGKRLQHSPWRVPLSALLLAPYPVYALPTGHFEWAIFIELLAVVEGIVVLKWAAAPDWLILIILALAVEIHYFDRAWPLPFAKLLFVDVGLYAYLAMRPLEGIGFDFRPHWSDWVIGLREFLFFTPIALLFGFATNFLHLHRTLSSPLEFGSAWVFTLFFVAVPEEFFFRGVMLNLLQRRLGTRRALLLTSAIFGLAHFSKRAVYFNWRYVILAAIAGIFYGRAWLAKRRVLTSSITHATVDTVWSIWLR